MRQRVGLAFGLAVLFGGPLPAAAQTACAPASLGTAQVRSVVDGRTLLLTDGRAVRLGGIEAADSAKAALESLVGGREVTLWRLSGDDRYGRIVALAAVAPGTAEQSVQRQLLERGDARVAAHTGEFACAANLLRAERSARAARLGLWADPYYVMRNAEDPAGILAVRGRFAVVQGKVLSVRESGALIYVNFGRRWTEDFTVTMQKRHERAFTAAGLPLKKLAGQHVRVRGHIEERGGPWIEAARPEQIEIAERGHE